MNSSIRQPIKDLIERQGIDFFQLALKVRGGTQLESRIPALLSVTHMSMVLRWCSGGGYPVVVLRCPTPLIRCPTLLIRCSSVALPLI